MAAGDGTSVSSVCSSCGREHPPDIECGDAERWGFGATIGGKYVLTRKIGEGGMGAVYEARHAVLGRRFAVKFLLPECSGYPEAIARFEREARAPGAIECENIAAVIDFGQTEVGAPYIVMEYLDGEDVRSLIKREGALPVPRATELAIQVCRGLEAAHEAGIVHRDLKPDNMFITRRGDGSDLVKLVDFGIAKLVGEAGSGFCTQTGTLLGTPYYMAPEQARGDKSVDLRADLYALGATLYEALSGNVPHPGTEQHAVLFHIVYEQAERLETLRPNLPAGLADVVHQAIATNPDDRFQTAREFSRALAPYARPGEGKPAPIAMADTCLSTAAVPVADSLATAGAGQGQASGPTTPGARGAATPADLGDQPTLQARSLAGTAASVSARRSVWATALAPVAIAVGAVVVVVVALRSGNDANEAPASDPMSESSLAQPEAATTGIELTISGAPSGARIYFEGALVPSNPFRVKPADTLAPLRVEADGFEPLTVSVVPGEDQVVKVAMKSVASAPAAAQASAAAPPPVSPPAHTTTAAARPPPPAARTKPGFTSGKSGAEFTERFE